LPPRRENRIKQINRQPIDVNFKSLNEKENQKMSMTKEQKDFMKALAKATKFIKRRMRNAFIDNSPFHSITFWERRSEKVFVFKAVWSNGYTRLIQVKI